MSNFSLSFSDGYVFLDGEKSLLGYMDINEYKESFYASASYWSRDLRGQIPKSNANGVWMTQQAHRLKGGLHSNNTAYVKEVTTRLSYASSRSSAEAILRGIKSDIRNGVSFK